MSGDSFIFKNDRPWPNPRLKRAAIVGHTTDTTCRLWFRTGGAGSFTVLVYEAAKDPKNVLYEGFKSSDYSLSGLPGYVQKHAVEIADYASDTTYVLALEGLTPGVEHRYALYGGDEAGNGRIVLGQDRPHSFKTMPAETDEVSFAVFSCHMPYKKSLFGATSVTNIEMWECLNSVVDRHAQNTPVFMIAGGDQAYTDGVKTLDIWTYLNKDGIIRKEGGELLPSYETMVSWYRDIYRGYWGFQPLRKAYSSHPTYMIWDDHELGDGWGSFFFDDSVGGKDEVDEVFGDWKKKGLAREDCLTLYKRMGEAAKQTYKEYQHAHNPQNGGHLDYSFTQGPCAFYVLDGRGHRDVNRAAHRILGEAQMQRFKDWAAGLDLAATPFAFVVSAVPVLHMSPSAAEWVESTVGDWQNLEDDLRDAWEHPLHKDERKVLMDTLFDLADRDGKVSILSGDVHTSAVFRMHRPGRESAGVYQLTSSAITYSTPRAIAWVLGSTVPDDGKTPDGNHFERLALYTNTNFALVKADRESGKVVFQLYGEQSVTDPKDDSKAVPVSHSIAKIKLF